MGKSDVPKKPAKTFEQLARESGADESGEKFERAFKKIAPEKKPEKRGDSDER